MVQHSIQTVKWVLCAATVLLVCAGDPTPAQPSPTGSEFQINTNTINDQRAPAAARDVAGNFLVTWSSRDQDGDSSGVFGQRYDAAGMPQGPEFQVHTFTTGFQGVPAVAMEPGGGFVVVWHSRDQDGSGNGIFGRLFDPSGTPVDGEFQVNTYTTNSQSGGRVAMDATGNFVVVWQSRGQYETFGYNIIGRRFTADGTPLGGEFQVNTFTTDYQWYPDVDMDSTGNFVVAWSSYTQDGDGLGAFGRRFDAGGNPLGGEFQVNTYTTSWQDRTKVALSDSGEFVVIWHSLGQDGDGYGIHGQRFEVGGNPEGAEFLVNTFTTSAQLNADVSMDPWGNFLVVWSSYGNHDGDSIGAFGQLFGSAGTLQGGEFQINTFTTGGQGNSSVVGGSAEFLVTWTSGNQDGSYAGVFGQRFDNPNCTPEPGPVTGLQVATASGGAELQMTWSPAAEAESYLVYEDSAPDGPFGTVTGTTGTLGLTVPTPTDTRFYRAAGRNIVCGVGTLE